MNKSQSRVTFSSEYLKSRELEECSKALNNMTVSDIRVLIYIEDVISRIYHNHIIYEREDLHNLLLIKLDKYKVDSNKQLNLLIKYKVTRTIPLGYFEWALNDLRSIIYLGVYVLYSNINMPALRKINYISFIELVVRVNRIEVRYDNQFIFSPFHFSRGSGAGVDSFINDVSIYKNYYLEEKVKSKSVKWIDRRNDNQIDFLFDYLKDFNKIIMLNVFVPSNSEEKYAQILASIDFLPDLPSDENSNLPPMKKNGEIIRRDVNSVREYYLNSMKNAWNGRAHRKEKLIEKSECHVSITKRNFAKLSELSKLHSTSPNKLINEWIVREHEVVGKHR